MEGIRMIPMIVLMIAISGIVIGASAIVLAKFGDTTTDADATNAINNASASVVDISEQLPTVAIIAIMVIIISVIAGVFAYMNMFR